MPAHPREQRHILTYTLLLCTSFSQELIRIVMMYGGIHTYDINYLMARGKIIMEGFPVVMSRVIVYFMLLPPLMYLL